MAISLVVPSAETRADEAGSWDLSSVYPSFAACEADLARVEKAVAALEGRSRELAELRERYAATLAAPVPCARDGEPACDLTATAVISACAQIDRESEDAAGLLQDLHVYAFAHESIGRETLAARAVLGRVSALAARLERANDALQALLLTLTPEDFARFVSGRGAAAMARWSARRMRGALVDGGLERVVGALGTEGFKAWASLYDELARTLAVPVTGPDGTKVIADVTTAVGRILEPDEAVRQEAWQALRHAWQAHEIAVAAVLSNMAGWRLKVARLRRPSGESPLQASLRENRLSSDSLTQLMAAAESHRPSVRRAVALMARLLGKTRLDVWDLAAGYDGTSESAPRRFSYAEGVALIERAFAAVSTEMGGFVAMMRDRRWIDARPPGAGRRLGGFQTSVARDRHPLVFVNYLGRWHDLITLAHELGHAYHYWVMRDLPAECHHLPLTLAESASSYAEMIVRDAMLAEAGDTGRAARLAAWCEAQTMVAFLLNTPASFMFEKDLYEMRVSHAVGALELRRMMDVAWEHWFGDSLATYDDLGWARKPHFASARPFYNYPYMFGYLIATGLAAERERRGAAFAAYLDAVLRDAGTSSVEELTAMHFGRPSSEPAFWDAAFARALGRLEQAQKVLEAAAGASPKLRISA